MSTISSHGDIRHILVRIFLINSNGSSKFHDDGNPRKSGTDPFLSGATISRMVSELAKSTRISEHVGLNVRHSRATPPEGVLFTKNYMTYR